MKKRIIQLSGLFVLAGAIFLSATGCSNHNIDTAKVRAAFAGIDGDAKTQLETGLTAIDAGNYDAALKPLKIAAFEIKMDKNQRAILEDTIRKARVKAQQQK
jgi:hypothetical protein